MAFVKGHEWSCYDLRQLHVRFRGLEVSQLIDRCMKIVSLNRRRLDAHFPSNAPTLSDVSRYWSQFDKLKTVSFGVSKPKSPLDLSGIRAIIAIHLDREDLVICLRVSRDWFKDFVGPVWHTIDFVKDKKFVDLPRQVFAKYGCSICRVLNISTFKHIKVLQHPKVDSVVSMSVDNFGHPFDRTLMFDLIRRCNATLAELDFRGPALSWSSDLIKDQNGNYLEAGILTACLAPSPDVSAIGSRLTSLSLNRICFSHEGFTNLLQNSPNLHKLALSEVIVSHYCEEFEVFRDSSVTSLHASLVEIHMPDPVYGCAPSLLHQFSRLEKWHITSVDRSKNWSTDANFRRELRECCPRLKTLQFDHVADTDKLSDLLFDSFREPESCTFSAKNISNSVVLSLISHNTLTTIIITDQCTDATAMRWLYLIPKSCLHLEVLSMRDLILDIAIVKEHKWGCQDLQELHVRFEGLEDAQLINVLIKEWYLQRQRRYYAGSTDSIAAQIFRHLIGFSKLTTVSLGTKVHSLPRSCGE
ncbi:hypothetical protein BG015_002223 [Linnemannia schmuckeri]|uniref:Uncharacterized protein n=1 Tax=Linnemannia schmuckeri TaxID=64567 RepID=A0A9P5S6U0_9FUNG|nr:hypothetical protein BG015_002223 [Linnemannia schmuckeri]